MSEKQYGPQILAEVQSLYQFMTLRKPKYGSRELPHLISRHVPSLVYTPQFQRELSSLVERTPDWGRKQFIGQLFVLIGRYFGISVPDMRKTAPKSAKSAALADAVEARLAQLEMEDDESRLLMKARPQPWDDD